jgi:hypothetical protein
VAILEGWADETVARIARGGSGEPRDRGFVPCQASLEAARPARQPADYAERMNLRIMRSLFQRRTGDPLLTNFGCA